MDGKAASTDEEVMIDEFKALHGKLKVGSDIQVFGKTMKVAGIYSPQIGSRIKMPLSAMQRALSAEGKCFSILVKVADPEKQDQVRERRAQRVTSSGTGRQARPFRIARSAQKYA